MSSLVSSPSYPAYTPPSLRHSHPPPQSPLSPTPASISPVKDNIISAKIKLDELFLKWVSQEETFHYIRSLIHDAKTHPDTTSKKGLLSPPQNTNLVIPGSPPSTRRHHTSPPAKSKLGLEDDKLDDSKILRSSTSFERLPSEEKEVTPHIEIPSFYTPKTIPPPFIPPSRIESDINKIHTSFSTSPTLARAGNLKPTTTTKVLLFEEIENLTKSLWGGLPRIIYRMIYSNVLGLSGKGREISEECYVRFYKSTLCNVPNSETLLIHILRQVNTRDYLVPSDFRSMMRVLLDTHPGLEFLKSTPEFQERYIETVIVRIFYNINHNRKGRLAASEMQKARFLEALAHLDTEPDINKHLEYFSYEHFYVIYCKFWELDTDHDLVIDVNDLYRYGNGILTRRIVERVVVSPLFPRDLENSRLVTSADTAYRIKVPRMTYQEFVCFMLAEEDKTSSSAQEFWFQCLDLDRDGILSLYELEYFYKEQQERMESVPMESPPFVDVLCQMLDMLKPLKTTRGVHKIAGVGRGGPNMSQGSVPFTLENLAGSGGAPVLTLRDIKKQDSRLVAYFFNSFFNLTKFISFETKDPFQSDGDDNDNFEPGLGNPDSEWCRFAEIEYDRAVTEEANDNGSVGENEDLYY